MFRVVVPLVIARDASGRHVYLYQGAQVPDGLVDGEVERLAEGGFVAEVPTPAVPAPEPEPVSSRKSKAAPAASE